MEITAICSVCLACTSLIVLLDIVGGVAAGERLRVTDVLWAAVPVAAQVFVFCWGCAGLLDWAEGSALMVAAPALSVACMFSAHIALRRRRIARGLGAAVTDDGRAAYRVASLPIDLIALLAVGALCVLSIELPHNHDLAQVSSASLFVEWALASTVLVGLYFVGQRRGFLAALVPVASAGIGIAEYFVFLFKNQPLQPGDFFALGTAASVADAYTYVLSSHCLWAMASAVAALSVLSLVSHTRLHAEAGGSHNPEALNKPQVNNAVSLRPAAVCVNLVVGLALLASVVSNVCGVDYVSEYDIEVRGWDIQNCFSEQAYLPTFIAEFQVMVPDSPEGYTVEGAADLLATYAAAYDGDPLLGASASRLEASAQFDEEKPCVVAVMNETFSDLSIFEWMDPTYAGPVYYNSIDNCLQRGSLFVSINGGGTPNSEFEFLTGNSMASFGSGVYPYSVYDLSRTQSLTEQFKALGYSTLAVHPYNGQNWNRVNVYQTFGFDRFATIDDFADAETYRTRVSDQATYDYILAQLQSGTSPQFIFDVTMQNHSGYDTGLVPADELVGYQLADGSDDPLIDEYAASIAKSDEALKSFLAALSELDRKVVVVFFGDHQPYMTVTYNNRFNGDEEGDEHQQSVYQTSYIIWANYDVAGNDQVSLHVDLDASALGAELMQLTGAPLTDFQKARLTLREALPAIDAAGYRDVYGGWHYPSDDSGVDESDRARSDLGTLEYYNMFGDGASVFATKLQSEINE